MKEGWMPSQQTILDMMSSCPGVDIQYEKDKFVDYYLRMEGLQQIGKQLSGTGLGVPGIQSKQNN